MPSSSPGEPFQIQPRDFVSGLQRGLAVIESFGPGRESQTITATAAATGLSRAGARRSLLTLVALGYADFDGRAFRLTPRALRLGYAYLSSTGLSQIVQPHLERLSEELHESCSASILDGTEIVYIARAATRRILSIGLSVGTRLPAYATSMGRVLLAGLSPEAARHLIKQSHRTRLTPRTTTSVRQLLATLDQVRQDGFALVDQELERGLTSMAVPVRDHGGKVVAAINVGTPSQHYSRIRLKTDFLPRLLKVAAQLNEEFPQGGQPGGR